MKRLLTILLLTISAFAFGQRVKTTQINPTLPANFKFISNGHYFGADTAYFGNVLTRPVLTGNLVVEGDSFAFGSGASPSTLSFGNQLAGFLGLTFVNVGHPGISLGASGGTSAVQNLSSYVPTKGGSDQYLAICWGQNDINVNPTTYFEHQFALDWVTYLNYTIATGGWAANKIILTNVGWNPSTTVGALTAAQYASRQKQFSACVDSIATVYGCYNVKINQLMHYGGGVALISSDNQHPNNLGHTSIAKLAFNTMNPHLFQDGHQLEGDGLSQFNQVSLPKINNLPIGATIPSSLLGITNPGDTIGRLTQLPPNIGTATGGSFILNGNLFQTGWSIPSALTLNQFDIGLLQNSRIISIGGSNWTSIEPFDAGANINLRTGPTTGGINFYTNNTTLAATISFNGMLNLFNDLIITNGKKIRSSNSGSFEGGLLLFNSGPTSLYNTYSGGVINFLVSGGVNGGSADAFHIFPSANISALAGGAYFDNGYTFETNTARFNTSTGFGQILPPATMNAPIPSTTGGVITAGTYYYAAVAVDAFGNQTILSANEGSCTTTGSTSSIALLCSSVTNATSYRFYVGTTPGGENKYIQSATNSTTDIGSGYTTAAKPTKNTTILGGISSTGSAQFTGLNLNSTQTVVNNSTSGTTTFSEPQQGSSYKVVIIKLNAGLGTASYTFPVAFTTAPSVIATDDVTAGIVTSKSTSAVTVTGSTTTGSLMLIGY